jgi:hypothetical protein
MIRKSSPSTGHSGSPSNARIAVIGGGVIGISCTALFLVGSLKRLLLGQIAASFGRTPIRRLEELRDADQIALIKALGKAGSMGRKRT